MKRLALCIATAAVLLTAAAPAMAQVDIFAGRRGVGVEFGAPGAYYYGPGPYYGCGYNYPCGGYYDYYGGHGVVIGGHWHGHRHWHHHG